MDKSPDAFRTISEVSDWLQTPAHVLRFWESRFTQLKPVKRAGGRRYYRPGDMALLGGIKKLLHDDGLTIRGVQKLLREHGVRYVAALGPETLAPGQADLAPGQADLAPRTADIVLDETEYGTPGVIVAWQQDKARDSGRDAGRDAGRDSGRDQGRDRGQPQPPAPQEDAPEAPMHVDAPDLGDAPLTAAIYTLPNREALAEIPAEELADLEFGLSEAEDMAIAPELEDEWAALLAEEAAARSPAPFHADQEPADPVQPDLFSLDAEEPMAAHQPAAVEPPGAANAGRARPPRQLPADSDPGPDPAPGRQPLATLLRHMQASRSLVQAAELHPLYARLVELRKGRSLPVAPDRQ